MIRPAIEPRKLAAIVVVLVLSFGVAWWSVTRREREGKGRARTDTTRGDAGDAPGHGVGARTNDPAHMRVRGRVVDDDDEPLEGGSLTLSCLADDSVVTIEGGTVAIGDDGAFEGPGCAGTICAELHHPSAIAAAPWVLEVGRVEVLRATTLPRLWGVVEDRDGEPVVDASVRLLPPADAGDDPAALPVVTDSTRSDADGFWSVALVERPPCDPCREAAGSCAAPSVVVHDRLEIHVRAPGHAATQLEHDLATARGRAPEDPVRVQLGEPAMAIRGTLVDPAGRPYPRAQVLARSVAHPLDQHAVRVQDEPAFAFTELGQGEYELRAIQDGVELVAWTPAPTRDGVALVGDRRADGPDVIVAITRGGQPVEDVRVDGGPFRDASTDMQGQVRATRVLPGPLRLRLRQGARRAITRTIDVPDTAGAPSDPHAFTIELSAAD